MPPPHTPLNPITQTSSSWLEPEKAQLLVCRSILAYAYLFAEACLRKHARELGAESEEGNYRIRARKAHSARLKYSIGNVKKIIHGKWAIRNVRDVTAHPHTDDLASLDVLDKNTIRGVDEILHELETKPPETITDFELRSKDEELARRLNGYANALKSESEKVINRQHDLLRQIMPLDGYLKQVAETKDCAVISVDQSGYTEVAQTVDNIIGAKAVFDYNQQLMEAIHKAIGTEFKTLPIDGTGDGALIFSPTAKDAVKMAQELLRILNSVDDNKLRKCVRIGIATGPVHLVTYTSACGTIVRFDAGGDIIIQAVRHQSEASAPGIRICESTYAELSKDAEKLHCAFNPKSTKITVKGRDFMGHDYQGYAGPLGSASSTAPSRLEHSWKSKKKTLKSVKTKKSSKRRLIKRKK